MQTINREKFLGALEAVMPGINKREVIEQSSCFVFKDKRVITFNDETACFMPVGITLTGAVQAQILLDLLRRTDAEEITVLTEEGKEGREFVVKSKRGRAGFRFEAEVVLPVDKIEIPAKFSDLPSDFMEALNLVQHSASTDESLFAITCIHIAPKFIEATDRVQVARYPLNTGVTESLLIRKTAISPIIQCGMTQYHVAKEWLWLRNPLGLIVAIRRHTDSFVNLTPVLSLEAGKPLTLPASLGEIVERASIFSKESATEDMLTVQLEPGKLRIKAVGASGWYKEHRKIDYTGPSIEFIVPPNLLTAIAKRGSECEVTRDKLKVGSGKFTYITCLTPTGRSLEASDEAEEGDTAPKAKKAKKTKRDE